MGDLFGPPGQIRISLPHVSEAHGPHFDVDFVNSKHGSGQLILPFPRIHVPEGSNSAWDKGSAPKPDSGSR